MAKLIIRSEAVSPNVIELKPGLNRLGRSHGNDHPVNHPSISERHCEITVGRDMVLVRDLGSTNGTFIDHQPIQESELRVGQTLRMGPLEMVFEDPPQQLSIPDLPPVANPFEVSTSVLDDGHQACVNHQGRHAVWDCSHCGRVFCDECIRKLRRVGGSYMRFCPTCNARCRLSKWAETVKGKKRNFFSTLADKMKTSFKRTKWALVGAKPPPTPAEKRKLRKK